MVTCVYEGRGGNNLFQYAVSRLIAEKNNLNLSVKTPSLVRVVNEHKNGLEEISERNNIEVRDMYRDNHALNPLDNEYRNKNVMVHGFFQNAAIYNPYRDAIRDWFEPCTRETHDSNTVVMHARLTDYWGKTVNSVIHPSWYFQALGKIGYSASRNRLVIVTENHSSSAYWLRSFHRYSPVLVSSTIVEDFNYIRAAKNILCSNSSFAWWAAFLSRADNIVTFGPWLNRRNFSIIPLAGMVGAIVMQGGYHTDNNLLHIDWRDYWKVSSPLWK